MSVFQEYRFIQIEPGDRPRLVLPVRITNPKNKRYVNHWAFVDTGADRSAFPGWLRSVLGLSPRSGVKRSITTGSGPDNAYANSVQIDIFGLTPNLRRVDTTKIIHSVSTLIDFMPNLGSCLIGVESFLEDFILSVDYQRRVFSLSKRDR